MRPPTRPTTTPRPTATGLERDLVAECCDFAAQVNAHLEVSGQRNAKGSGTTVGAPDATLYQGEVSPSEWKTRADEAKAMLRLAYEADVWDPDVVPYDDWLADLARRTGGDA